MTADSLRKTGLPGGDRTPDPQLRRLLLYPTELRADLVFRFLSNKKAHLRGLLVLVVGAERFELPTLWSQTRCATRLRYAPTRFKPQIIGQKNACFAWRQRNFCKIFLRPFSPGDRCRAARGAKFCPQGFWAVRCETQCVSGVYSQPNWHGSAGVSCLPSSEGLF